MNFSIHKRQKATAAVVIMDQESNYFPDIFNFFEKTLAFSFGFC